MKRLLLLICTLSPLTVLQAGEPSAMFGQELARVAQPNAINLDLYPAASNLRVGLDDGEIILNTNTGIAGSQSLSYKWFLNNELAMYGGLGINTGTADHVIVGAAYTINNDNIRFNINPVLDAGGGTTQTDLYLGAFMKFDGIKNKKMMLGAQMHLDLNTSTNNNVTLGLRWLARENVTIDLALYNNNNLEFPGLFAVNMSF